MSQNPMESAHGFVAIGPPVEPATPRVVLYNKSSALYKKLLYEGRMLNAWGNSLLHLTVMRMSTEYYDKA